MDSQCDREREREREMSHNKIVRDMSFGQYIVVIMNSSTLIYTYHVGVGAR